jgi:hypothetical protein
MRHFVSWCFYLCSFTAAVAAEPVYPVHAGENGRYFVDQKGAPVFWLGTTQWELFRGYTLEEARTIIEKSKEHGFAFVQVMIAGVGDGTRPNRAGEQPWPGKDPLAPNEAYFKHVDAVVQIAREKNLVISMMIFHQCGTDLSHDRHRLPTHAGQTRRHGRRRI